MSIYPLEKDIVGTYYYEKNENEIRLQGKSGKENIVLKIALSQGGLQSII